MQAITIKDNGGISKIKAALSSDSIKEKISSALSGREASFTASLLAAVTETPGLEKCDPSSVISSALMAAVLGLPINKNLGFAYVIPYSGVAQFQMGWKGLVQLAIKTNKYHTINAAIVYEGQLVARNSFTGEITLKENRVSSKPIGYLLYFKLINGFEKYFYMSKEEAEVHGRKHSKSYAKGVWSSDFDSMALKTVVKLGLSRWGVLSPDMERAISADQGVVDFSGKVVSYPDSGMSSANIQEAPQLSEAEQSEIMKEVMDVIDSAELADFQAKVRAALDKYLGTLTPRQDQELRQYANNTYKKLKEFEKLDTTGIVEFKPKVEES